MRNLGYIERQSIEIDWRSADGNADRLPALADEVVRSKPTLIVAAQTQAISAIKRATSSIPIVFVATPDPVSSGFVNSLARPGGNLTGFSTSAADLGSKQIEVLKSALPKCSRLAFLANPTNNASAVVRKVITAAAQEMKLQVLSLDAQNLHEIERALGEAKRCAPMPPSSRSTGFSFRRDRRSPRVYRTGQVHLNPGVVSETWSLVPPIEPALSTK